MTAVQQCIEYYGAVPSTKYLDRYDVAGNVDLHNKNISLLPTPFGVVKVYFDCSHNQLTSLYKAPIEVHGDFCCHYNKLTTLDHLPKYIAGDLYCQYNPFQNLNGLKDVMINGYIMFNHETVNELDYWIKALFNTDLDALEYHYDNHKYRVSDSKLENYIKDVLEEIIKIKTMKNHLNL